VTEALQVAGCIAAVGALSGALFARERRLRAGLVVAGLAIAFALILGEAWDELSSLRDRPAVFAASIALGAGALAALALGLRRYPLALPLLLVAALPFRIPIGVGSEDANLLLPLYAVIGAGSLAALATAFERGGRRERFESPLLLIALAAAIVLYALQAAYSEDIGFATRNVAFFLVPFAAMFVLLNDADWTPRLLGLSLGIIAAEAVLFAVVGAGQFMVQEIFWNPALERSNDFHFYFRVNSLFWDPNIYGRYLALAAVLVAGVVLWARDPRRVGTCAAILVVILAGMVFGLSQTSFIALLIGVGVLCGLRYSALAGAVALPLLVVVAFAAVVVVGGTSEAEDDTQEISSGRSTLIEGGVELFEAEPVAGHGSASFSDAFAEQEDISPAKTTISHNEPVTVAAEQGVIGIAVYVAVLLAAAWTLLAGMRRFAPGLGAPEGAIGDPDGDPGARLVARIALAGAFAAMIVHTVGYGAFLTDPLTWAILAIAASLAATGAVGDSGRAGLQAQ
jgi:putative inorganic carbon (hco3(-)) transporter